VSLWPVVSARRAASAIDPLSLHDALPIFRASGTNADVISDILADLPIVRQKESGGPGWHRYDELVSFNPDLIVMHYSTFRGSNADRKSTRLNSSHVASSYAVFCLKKKKLN